MLFVRSLWLVGIDLLNLDGATFLFLLVNGGHFECFLLIQALFFREVVIGWGFIVRLSTRNRLQPMQWCGCFVLALRIEMSIGMYGCIAMRTEQSLDSSLPHYLDLALESLQKFIRNHFI
jgi:hypothetical protein